MVAFFWTTAGIVVLIVAAILVVWSGWSYYVFRRGTQSLASELEKMLAALEGDSGSSADAKRDRFVTGREAINRSIEVLKTVGRPWAAFSATLVTSVHSSGPLRSTSDPRRWFDATTLISRRNDPRYHAAMPNLLVGAGLLATFAGIAFALSSAGGIVVGGSADARNSDLKQLLDTAGAKFLTSVVGMACSILYALGRKSLLKRIEGLVEDIVVEIEMLAPALTPGDVLRESIDIQGRQLRQMELFNAELAPAISTAFNEHLGVHMGGLKDSIDRLANGLRGGNEEALRTMLEAFVEQMRGGMGDSMRGTVASLERLGEQLKGLEGGLGSAADNLASASSSMSERMRESGDQAIESMAAKIETLVGRLSDFSDRTRNASEAVSAGIAEQIAAATGALKDAVQGIGAGVAEEAAAQRHRVAEQTEEVVATMRSLAEEAREANAEAALELASKIEAAAQAFDRAAGASVERISAFQRALAEAATPMERLTSGLKQAGDAVVAAARPFEQTAKTLEGVAESTLEASDTLRTSGEAADALARKLAAAAERFEGVDTTLASTVRELQKALDAYGESTSRNTSEIDKNLGEAVGKLGSYLKGLEETLSDLVDTLPKRGR